MTRSARHTASHAGLLEDTTDAFDALAAVVAETIADERTSPAERRAVFAAFADLGSRLRMALLDAYRVDAGSQMVKAIAHTLRLTEDVAETLRDLERDLARIERIEPGARLRELFPDLAA